METRYVYAGWLIDGMGGCIQEKVLLTIIEGRWAAVEKRSTAHIPAGGRVTDLSHCTIVPPLIDCCVHMALSGTTDPKQRKQQRTAGYSPVKKLIKRHGADFLSHGVFAVRDCSDKQSMLERFLLEQGTKERAFPVQIITEAENLLSGKQWQVGKQVLDPMEGKPAFWTPLLLALHTLEKEHCYHQDKGNSHNLDDCSFAQQTKQVRLAKNNGIKIALGTNSGMNGILHGESMVEELKLLIKAGYSLSEAIQCATQHNAELLAIDNTLGGIAVGKSAHFLVTRGTPAQLPRKLSYLEAIYMNGKPCKQEYFRKI